MLNGFRTKVPGVVWAGEVYCFDSLKRAIYSKRLLSAIESSSKLGIRLLFLY